MDLSQLGNSIKQMVNALHQDDPDAYFIAFLPTKTALNHLYEYFETDEAELFRHEDLIDTIVFMHIFEGSRVLNDTLTTVSNKTPVTLPITFSGERSY